MDIGCNIENIQIHLNVLETIYQKSPQEKTSNCFIKKTIRKIYLLGKYFSENSVEFLNEYLKKMWFFLPSLCGLKNWFYYWSVNSFDLIFMNDSKIFIENSSNMFAFSEIFVSNVGCDFPNSNTLLSLYAGTMAFACIKKKNHPKMTRYNLLNIYLFIKKLKTKKGSFRSFFLGESDSRLSYCAFIVLSVYNILTPEISTDCEKYIKSIQINDGSFSENKFREGHGAFFYCCIANLIFFSKINEKLLFPISYNNWVKQKLKFFDFSIQGRTSKLTDCCYFFWIGAASIIGSIRLYKELINGIILPRDNVLAGFSDKIGRNLDLYHTCYGLCGLSILGFNNINKQKFLNSKLNPVYGVRESLILNFLN